MTGGLAPFAGVSVRDCVTPALTNDPPMASEKLSNSHREQTARRIIYLIDHCWEGEQGRRGGGGGGTVVHQLSDLRTEQVLRAARDCNVARRRRERRVGILFRRCSVTWELETYRAPRSAGKTTSIRQ